MGLSTDPTLISKQGLLVISVILFGLGSVTFLYSESRWKDMNVANGLFIVLGLVAGMAMVALGLCLVLLAIQLIS